MTSLGPEQPRPMGTQHKTCLPGTRVPILQEAREWSRKLTVDKRVFWLCDVGGSGKSTVALGVLQQLSRRVDRVAVFRPIVRPDMATHGKYGQPCPRCGSKIQRIRYGSNETNYCPKCQTGGKLLADRALSRLLKDDWPRTPEELENLTKG